MQKVKAWITYSGRPEFWTCSLVLENGYIPCSHICSHPIFAPDDLILGRVHRIEAFKRMGVKIELAPGVYTSTELEAMPGFSGVMEKIKNDSGLAFGAEYEKHLAGVLKK